MPDPLVDALAASRERTFAIVAHLDDGSSSARSTRS